MIYRVSWTSKARESYNQNLDYLAQNWEEKVYSDFVSRVEYVINKIMSNPKMYVLIDPKRNIFRCVVTKHISLFYQVAEDEILRMVFWNNFQEPEKLVL
jgi:plasmid stabilization system protein ParE